MFEETYRENGEDCQRDEDDNVMFGRKPLPKGIRHEVYRRDNFKCSECGTGKDESPLEVDHIIPVSKGGTDELFNLRTLCKQCNREKGDLIHSNFNLCDKIIEEPKVIEEKKAPIIIDTEPPRILAIPRNDGMDGLKFYCGHCKRWHFHGNLEGLRAAHCHGQSPLRDTGYEIVKAIVPENLNRKQLNMYERNIKNNWKGQFIQK